MSKNSCILFILFKSMIRPRSLLGLSRILVREQVVLITSRPTLRLGKIDQHN